MNEVNAIDLGFISYFDAWEIQKKIFQKRQANKIVDSILFCEHPHTYTIGKTGSEKNLLISKNELRNIDASFVNIDRGGDITYHGPGQLVVYPIINLSNYFKDVHKYLRMLEEVIIHLLSVYKVKSDRIDDLTGVWVKNKKICAIGVKISRWITMHGLAFNVSTDLNYFQKIIPCGIADKGVCNLSDIVRKQINLSEVIEQVTNSFEVIFKMNCREIEKKELLNLIGE